MTSFLAAMVVTLSFFSYGEFSAAAAQCDGNALTSCDQLARAPIDASHASIPGLAPAKAGEPVFNSLAFLTKSAAPGSANDKAFGNEINAFLGRANARKTTSLAVIDRVRKETKAFIADEAEKACEARKKAKRSCVDLIQERDALVRRLDLIKIETLTGAETECTAFGSRQGFTQGGYYENSHSMGVCPAALGLSEDQLVQFFSHEFGHAIDSCTASKTLFKVSPGGGDDPLAGCDETHRSEDDDSGEQQSAVHEIGFGLLKAGADYAVLDANDPTNKKLASPSCGFIKPIAGTKVSHPALFSDSQSCLKKLYAPSYSSFIAKTAYQNAQANGGNTSAGAIAAEATKLRASTPPECERINQEHFADSVSAVVVGRMAAKSNWSAADLQTALAFHRGLQCRNAQVHGDIDDVDYPKPNVRVATLMNDPEIARRLNCQPLVAANLCPIHSDLSGASPSGAKPQASASTSKGAK